MNSKISIIVPVYNVSQYIERCILSLVNQKYDNIEIIVVDDGSTDDSGEICNRLSGQYPEKVRVLHTLNGGLSAARNRGIQAATGTYIGFVDGDDWVEPEMFETLHFLIEKFEADLSVCALKYDFTEGRDTLEKPGNINFASQEELFNLLINNRDVLGYACNKLFKLSIVKFMQFDESLYSSEDIDFCARYAQKCNRVVYCDSQLYHYRQRIGSMTGEFAYSFRKLSVIRAYERLIPVYERYNPSNKYVIEKYLLKQNLNVIGRIKISKHKDIELKKRLQANVKSLWKTVMNNPRNSISEKLNIAFTRAMPATMLRIKQTIIIHRYQ